MTKTEKKTLRTVLYVSAFIIILGCFITSTIVLYKSFHPVFDWSNTTKDKAGAVVCDFAFSYDDTGDTTPTLETVKELEEMSAKLCRNNSTERGTDNFRNPDGSPKHAVLIGGEVCTINFELTPKEHIRAFNEICKLSKNIK